MIQLIFVRLVKWARTAAHGAIVTEEQALEILDVAEVLVMTATERLK